MDGTAFDVLGKQFRDFLVKQFAPPPGTRSVLGFLGAGVAVDPASFLSQGEYNPARVNAWLDIVAEPLGSVSSDDNRVDPVPLTAYSLMESICSFSVSLAPVGSDAQLSFAKIRSQASESLGGATTVDAAPLDWYDPKHLPEWAKCSLATSTTTGNGSTATTPPPPSGTAPPRARLWAWRTLPNVQVSGPAPVQPPPVAREIRVMAPMMRESMLMGAFQPSAAAAPTATLVRPAAFATVNASRFAQVASLHDPAETGAMTVNANRFRVDQAIMVSREIAAVANQASTSGVDSSSLTLNLNYLVVQLSRAPWWSDLLLLLDDWCVPGLQRGALVGESGPENTIGVPIALILTANTQIQANWSETDRSSAATSTHLGPWALDAAQFGVVNSTGQSTLTIPGIQAVACIYRALPVIPPQPAPAPPPA